MNANYSVKYFTYYFFKYSISKEGSLLREYQLLIFRSFEKSYLLEIFIKSKV